MISKKGIFWVIGLLVLFFFFIFWNASPPEKEARPLSDPPPSPEMIKGRKEAEIKLKELEEVERKQKGERQEQEAVFLGLRWQYRELPEKMGRGTVKLATVRSLNEVEFDFPYRNPQRATLELRNHPKYGKDVTLEIERGQFLCGFRNCQVSVRFDNGKPQNFSAVEPADHSTTMLFIRGYDRFLASARKAKKVYIEALFFQQGTRVFEFDISNLKW